MHTHYAIGRQGKVVEIDKSHITSTAKYNTDRKHRKSHHWVFGGLERGCGKNFVVCLGMEGKRGWETLELFIVRYILLG